MNKKAIFGFFSLLFVMLVGVFAAGAVAASSTVVATDPHNDVTVYAWNASINAAAVKVDQSKPVVDITTLTYGKDSNGNMTIGLTVVGTPVIDNQTFYLVILTGDNITATAWAGSYDNTSTDCTLSCSYLAVGGSYSLDYSNNSAVISGSTITWTFPRQVAGLDSNYNLVMQDVNLPDTPNATWSWMAEAWTGTTAYSSTPNIRNLVD